MKFVKYTCPCCGYKTLDEEPPGTHEIARLRVRTNCGRLTLNMAILKGKTDSSLYYQSINVYDRSIVEYYMGLGCTTKDLKQTLLRALFKRQRINELEKPVIRTDNGPQFISHAFGEFCEKYTLEHERIPPKTPNMNAHIESFYRIFEDDCLSRWQFETYVQAYVAVAEFKRKWKKWLASQ